MKLTYPKTHTLEDIKVYYERFRDENPALAEDWLKLELNGREVNPMDFLPIEGAINNFLKDRMEYEGNISLSMAFLDFRLLIREDKLGEFSYDRKFMASHRIAR